MLQSHPPPSSCDHQPSSLGAGGAALQRAQREAATRLIAGRTLHAPWLLDHEIASVSERKRSAGIGSDITAAAIAAYMEYDVTLHRTSPDVVLPLATTYALSTYDAAYLALAARLHVPLVTFDHKLGKAAMRHLGTLG